MRRPSRNRLQQEFETAVVVALVGTLLVALFLYMASELPRGLWQLMSRVLEKSP